MLGWAITFLVIAAMSAFLGFGGIAGSAAGAAQLVFFVAIILLVATLTVSLLTRGPRGAPGTGFFIFIFGFLLGLALFLWFDRDMSQRRQQASRNLGGYVTIDDVRTDSFRKTGQQQSE